MKIKYILPLFCILSITFAGNERKTHGKKWHKKHFRNYKHQSHKVINHHRKHLNIRYGINWCFTARKNIYHPHNHNDLVVIRDEKVTKEDNMEIFSQIEKLGELKQSGLLTEEEFEKAKKDLLEKI